MIWFRTACVAALALAAPAAQAVDYRLEPLEEAAPADAVASDILAKLQPQGFRVFRGANRVLADVWLAQPWNGRPDFQPSAAINYPFQVGDLIGAVRYKSKAKDFRGQEIGAGVYLLRYGNQPVDGNHVGTSDTRDFLLLTPAGEDKSPDAMEEKALFKLSATVAGKTHPTMLSLVRPEGAGQASVRHEEEHDWWIVHLLGQSQAGDQQVDQPLHFVLVGQAEM